MWFVIQLEEYLNRSNDREVVDALKPKVLELFKYFESYTNNDGLLEKLDSWVFVEWSKANKFVQDVNYPTNMLYSAALKATSNMYNLPELNSKADKINAEILKQSYNGQFFVDNAIRNKNGELKITKNISEVCQYYAFYFNIATPETHSELWNNLVNHFGPQRRADNKFPKVHFANSFPGNYLRLELLSRDKRASKILDESIDFFSYMAERTGTLWEHKKPEASCNHGFASHTVHFLYRDVLGIFDIDIIRKKITLQFSDLDLESCNGQIPVGDEVIALEWKKKGNDIHYKVSAPEGYKVDIVNLSGLKLIEQ
jgi:alpha-L-rhamnosidase